jgi:mono/diheme cytochrome c family protein
VFLSRCRACHASGGEKTANAYPDLWNLSRATHGAFESIVLKGTLSYAGMQSFSDALSGDDVRANQAFIISDEINSRNQSATPASGGQ